MVEKNIWEYCVKCSVNCCGKREISFPLFLTENEKKIFPCINKTFPCKFLDNNGLCKTYETRPIDCRLFPFDIANEGGIFYWIYWDLDCLIIRDKYVDEWDSYLQKVETTILPEFSEYVLSYSKFRNSEFIKTFGMYKIIREVKLKL